MIIYRKKLKNNIKNKFIRYDDNIENMKNFIKISIELDDKFYEKIMKKHYNSREKSNIYVEILNFRNNNNKNQRNDINYEITSIKLNITIRRKKKDRDYLKNTFYYLKNTKLKLLLDRFSTRVSLYSLILSRQNASR